MTFHAFTHLSYFRFVTFQNYVIIFFSEKEIQRLVENAKAKEETRRTTKPEGNKSVRITRALAKNIEVHSTSEDEDEMECDSI